MLRASNHISLIDVRSLPFFRLALLAVHVFPATGIGKQLILTNRKRKRRMKFVLTSIHLFASLSLFKFDRFYFGFFGFCYGNIPLRLVAQASLTFFFFFSSFYRFSIDTLSSLFIIHSNAKFSFLLCSGKEKRKLRAKKKRDKNLRSRFCARLNEIPSNEHLFRYANSKTMAHKFFLINRFVHRHKHHLPSDEYI